LTSAGGLAHSREILNRPGGLFAIELGLDAMLPIVVEELSLHVVVEFPENHAADLPLDQLEEFLVEENTSAQIS